MTQPKISFTLSQGGLGRPLPGYDHYSAMIAYEKASSATSAYATIGDTIYNSLLDAENELVAAQNNYTTSLLEYKLAEIQFIKSKGELKTLTNK